MPRIFDPSARCRVCGCSEEKACAGGCGWSPQQGNLCTVCYAAVLALKAWMKFAQRPSFNALRRELISPLRTMSIGGGL